MSSSVESYPTFAASESRASGASSGRLISVLRRGPSVRLSTRAPPGARIGSQRDPRIPSRIPAARIAIIDTIARVPNRVGGGVTPPSPGTASASRSSSRASPISRRRLPGSFCRQRRTTRTTDAGATFASALQSGSRSMTRAIVSDTSSPSNGRLPASISYRTHPNAHTSARLSTVLPRACSGLM